MGRVVIALLESYVKSDPVVQDLMRHCGCRTEDIASVTGGAVSVLTDLGVGHDEAHALADGLARGGTLLTVRTPTAEAAVCALALLRRAGVQDVAIPPSAGPGYDGPERRRAGAPGYAGPERRVLH